LNDERVSYALFFFKPLIDISVAAAMNRILLLVFVITFGATGARSQNHYFPPLIGNTWDTVSAASLGWCQAELDSLLDFVGQRNSKAFILLKNGKIVAERYYGTFTVDSSWYWASAGKSLTAFLTGMAQQEGYLSIHDTTNRYLGAGWTSCTPQQEDRITVLNQLTMTSGLEDSVPDKDCTDDTCLIYRADAGSRWAYHNAPYTLLDPVIENATGRTINQYFNQKLAVNTGMTGLYLNIGYNNVFFSKPRSFARFGLLILNSGAWNGNQIMTDTTYFRSMVNSSQSLNPSYGYLWWLNGKSSFMAPGYQFVFPGSWSPSAPPDMFAAMGKNGQLLNVVPSMNLVWIRMGEEPSGSFVPFALNDTIWQKLNAVFCSSTALSGQPMKRTVACSPNPATDHVRFRTGTSAPYTVRITDVAGQFVVSYNNITDDDAVNVNALKPGCYVCSLLLADGQRFQVRLAVAY
jgi:CubicO group peptidase (beta-lactamase class C family)